MTAWEITVRVVGVALGLAAFAAVTVGLAYVVVGRLDARRDKPAPSKNPISHEQLVYGSRAERVDMERRFWELVTPPRQPRVPLVPGDGGGAR